MSKIDKSITSFFKTSVTQGHFSYPVHGLSLLDAASTGGEHVGEDLDRVPLDHLHNHVGAGGGRSQWVSVWIDELINAIVND